MGDSGIRSCSGRFQFLSCVPVKKLDWQFSGQTMAAPDSHPTYHILDRSDGE